jgi:hypothetical protein
MIREKKRKEKKKQCCIFHINSFWVVLVFFGQRLFSDRAVGLGICSCLYFCVLRVVFLKI